MHFDPGAFLLGIGFLVGGIALLINKDGWVPQAPPRRTMWEKVRGALDKSWKPRTTAVVFILGGCCVLYRAFFPLK
jgi:hypothetical protein